MTLMNLIKMLASRVFLGTSVEKQTLKICKESTIETPSGYVRELQYDSARRQPYYYEETEWRPGSSFS